MLGTSGCGSPGKRGAPTPAAVQAARVCWWTASDRCAIHEPGRSYWSCQVRQSLTEILVVAMPTRSRRLHVDQRVGPAVLRSPTRSRSRCRPGIAIRAAPPGSDGDPRRLSMSKTPRTPARTPGAGTSHARASMMREAGHSVVASAPRLGHSPPAITLGYYAHFMPEAGGEGRGAIDGLLAEREDRHADRDSPDSPRRRRPSDAASRDRRSPPSRARMKRWAAWENAERSHRDPLRHALA